MYCVNCGKELPEESKFCNFCGCEQVAQEKKAQPVDAEHIQKRKFDKKCLKYGVIAGVLMCLICCIIAIKANSLNQEEKAALDMVEKYQTMLKDPDSMKLQSDVVVIRAYNSDNKYHTYCFFTATGTNSFGAAISSTVYFCDYKYICDISSAKEDDFTDTDSLNTFLDGKSMLIDYQLHGADAEQFTECEVVPRKMVAKRANIDYAKN